MVVVEMDRAAIQRDNILKNSYRLFKEKGFKNTTTREIATTSQINKGLLHYYYNQKEDIVIEMYEDVLDALYNYVEKNYKDEVKGYTYLALLNILFYKTMTSTDESLNFLTEMMSSRELTKVKTEKYIDSYYKIIEYDNLSITRYQMLLALTVAVGAESELLLSIREGKIKMTYEKLATTVNKLLFTMLKVDEAQIKEINEEAKKIANAIKIEEVISHLKENCKWARE
ncbi:TetR/AcrR family transcriptional regulator [Soehngenia saccharolytica]|nr:TetR/AcrR family transcriptional regulator [Soehngenia saccharolytica]